MDAKYLEEEEENGYSTFIGGWSTFSTFLGVWSNLVISLGG